MTTILALVAASLALYLLALGIAQLHLRSHRGISREDFIRHFHTFNLRESIPGAVYDYYKSHAIWKRFSVSPDDRYGDAFSDQEDVIQDDKRHLVDKLRMRMAGGINSSRMERASRHP